MKSRDADAQRALLTIRGCVATDRIVVLRHFHERLAERNLLWADVLALLDAPNDVRAGGPERFGRPKWIVAGDGADGAPLEIVCVFDADATGEITVFVTLYRE